jgi:hypothetical protein
MLSSNELFESITCRNAEIASLSVKNVKTKVSSDEIKEVFPANIGNSPKVRASLFRKANFDFSVQKDVEAFVQVFFDNGYSGELFFAYPLEKMVVYEISLKGLDGKFHNIDQITAGTLSKIYINHFLDKQLIKAGSNIIILYDQPDANMEKDFILTQLVPKLEQLRKQYQIFITTHEPLLVVNADSNAIIRATNEKAVGKMNSITYENYSFVGVGGKQEMISEIAKLIDGSTDAISKRHTIYKGMQNEED